MTDNNNIGVRELEKNSWSTWTPLEELAPVFFNEIREGKSVMAIKGIENSSSYGKWITTLNDVSENQTCYFTVEYLADGIGSETLSVQAILTWKKVNGELIQRDYADNIAELTAGWKRLGRKITAPSGTASLLIELALRYPGNGSVYWRNPVLKIDIPEKERKVKIASPLVMIRNGLSQHSLEINSRFMHGIIDEAAKLKPDIICLGEKNFEECLDNMTVRDLADTVPGKRTAAVAEKAKLYNCYIIFSMTEKHGNNFYNTAVLIDRKGEIAGIYRKTHLPLSEAEEGYSPGNEYPVFETDFGKIGILICWDQMFPEAARIMAVKGAEIIFLPTQGDAIIQQEARAVDNGVYFVTSGVYSPISSRIVGPTGDILAVADEVHNYIAYAQADLNKKYYRYWMSVGPCYGEPRSLYIRERRPDTYSLITKDN